MVICKTRSRTDSIVNPHFECDTELCADAIRANHTQVGVARCLEIVNATETPDLGVCTGASRCTHGLIAFTSAFPSSMETSTCA